MGFLRWPFSKEAKAYRNSDRGVTHLGNKRYQKAVEAFSKAINLVPDNGAFYYFRGEAFLKMGSFESAIEDFSKAISLGSCEGWSYQYRGEAFLKLGNFENAIRDFGKALDVNVGVSPEKVRYKMGLAYAGLKQYNDAVESYSKAIKLKPDFADAYCHRGAAYCKLKDFNQALKDSNRAIKMSMLQVMPYFNRAIAYSNLGDKAQAVKDLEKFISKTPRDTPDHDIASQYLIQLKSEL